jgi:DNA repair protein RadC
MKIYKEITPELKLKRSNGTIAKVKIKNSQDSANFFRGIFDEETLEICESFMIVFLNNSNNTIGWFKASQGGITGTVVDIRLIFGKAFECYATGMILAHNHPSGGLTPSNADLNFTKKIKQAGDLLEIAVLDHIILTANSFYSMRDNGDI